MNAPDAGTAGDVEWSGAVPVCGMVIEACALVLLALSVISRAASTRGDVSVHVFFLVAAALFVVMRRLHSRAALFGIPLVLIFAYDRIDMDRFAVRIPTDAAMAIPVAAAVVTIMICSFVIIVLSTEAGRVFPGEPAYSFIAAVLFVIASGGVLSAAHRTMYHADERMLHGIVGTALSHGLLFMILSAHLSRRGTIGRFAWYVIVYSGLVVIVMVAG